MFTRLMRYLLKRQKTPQRDVSLTAAVLASYFGTWRDQPLTGDPRQRGHAVLQILACVPGPAAAVLRAHAERAISTGAWPQQLTTGTTEYALTARAIGEICQHLAAR